MALLQATLKTELLKLMDPDDPAFVGYASTIADACDNWANAYDIYAQAATDAYLDVLTSASKASFASTLKSSLPVDPSAGTYATTASAFDAAFVAYWLGPPPATFNIGSSAVLPPGFFVKLTSMVTVVTPAVLSAALLPILPVLATNPATTPAQAADAWATVFHAATTTAVLVVVAGTTPPPASAPIVTAPQPII